MNEFIKNVYIIYNGHISKYEKFKNYSNKYFNYYYYTFNYKRMIIRNFVLNKNNIVIFIILMK